MAAKEDGLIAASVVASIRAGVLLGEEALGHDKY